MKRTAEETAQYLRQYRAHTICRVLTLVAEAGTFRGKVNLGQAASWWRGLRNSYAAGYVERALHLGLIAEERDGAAYVYTLTELGRDVLTLDADA